MAEAGTAVSEMAYRGAYPAMTPREIDDMMAGQCYQADQIVMPGERVKIFCGVPFGILPLYVLTGWSRSAAIRMTKQKFLWKVNA